MASRDWFKERVDLGLLADDIDTSDNADSPFESTFHDQGGVLTQTIVDEQMQSFQQFCDVGEEGDTIIFYGCSDTYTEKVPRKDAIAALKNKKKQQAAAAAAQSASKEEATKSDVPDAAADEAKLNSTDTPNAPNADGPIAPTPTNATDVAEEEEGDGKASFLSSFEDKGKGPKDNDKDEEALYDIVTKERFSYRCTTAKRLEDMVLQATKAASKTETDGNPKKTDGNPETADDIMSSMQNGVVYFVRKNNNNLSMSMSAKQLGISDAATKQSSGTTLLRDLSMTNNVEWGCLRGLSVSQYII
tara:strand:+ start:142 stop:1050 length:909 start_codon:yes stop_codon:yes gene_type:complete